MCEWGTTRAVLVKIPADLSSTGREKWKLGGIDACIADLVDALQHSGVDMRGSCCGHGKYWGEIHLQDGRMLVITDESYWDSFRWGLRALRRGIRLWARRHRVKMDYWLWRLGLRWRKAVSDGE